MMKFAGDQGPHSSTKCLLEECKGHLVYGFMGGCTKEVFYLQSSEVFGREGGKEECKGVLYGN